MRDLIFLFVLAIFGAGNGADAAKVDWNCSFLGIEVRGNETTFLERAQFKACCFVQELFSKYGQEDRISYEGIEHLLYSIGFEGLIIDDHPLKDHFGRNQSFEDIHSDHHHNKSKTNEHHHDGHDHNHHADDQDHHHHDHDNDNHHHGDGKGHPETDYDSSSRKRRETPVKDHSHDEILSVPAMFSAYRIDQTSLVNSELFIYLCPAILQQLELRARSEEPLNTTSTVQVNTERKNALSLWGWASLAILIISIAGLACVAIIPIINKVFYYHLLQFLVSLAVGTLTGDALLHLIPHAKVSGSVGSEKTGDTQHSHDVSEVWRGIIVLAGIYIFFVAERVMSLVSDWRKERERRKGHDKSIAVEDILNDKEEQLLQGERQEGGKSRENTSTENVLRESPCSEHDDAEENHGHNHNVPSSLPSLAWMVIMGDGLHNLTDGMAIGAAFTQSIAVGLSTTIAVFCHELPHELGDFAVLIQAGMRIKQAIFYNIVSSILSYIGMVAGILLGGIESAKGWIFALTAGIFVYISLVDMLPQMMKPMSSQQMNVKQKVQHLLLQVLGISLGVTIMTMIALYEEQIMIKLTSSVSLN